MKKIAIFVLIALFALLTGCTTSGSGNVVAHEVDVSDFSKIEAKNGFTVNVSQGDTFSVVAYTDDNLVKNLQIDKKGDTLNISMAALSSQSDVTELRVEVTMPELTSLVLSNGCRATASGSGEEINMDVSEGCDADLSDYAVRSATVNASNGGSATVNVSDSLTATATNGSTISYIGSPPNLMIDAKNGGSVEPVD
jgi:hypothetical protein